MSLKIVFMGTPDFAVPSLRALIEHGYDVVGVITSTDKRGGRGNKVLIESAVKKFAVANGLNILQPRNLKAPEFVEELKALNVDLQIVVAFRMLPEIVWNMPTIGTINLHGSLLPKYRGAAPIHWAVINGEKETGVTTFFLKHEIDTGDILKMEKLKISDTDTTGDVHDRMMELGAKVILESVQMIEKGGYKLLPQNIEEVSKAPKLNHENCEINFNAPTRQVYNFIRGLSPFPTAWTSLDDKNLKIYRASQKMENHTLPPASIQSDGKSFFEIATADGFIQLLDLKLEGRKRMKVKDFLNGYDLKNSKIA